MYHRVGNNFNVLHEPLLSSLTELIRTDMSPTVGSESSDLNGLASHLTAHSRIVTVYDSVDLHGPPPHVTDQIDNNKVISRVTFRSYGQCHSSSWQHPSHPTLNLINDQMRKL